MIQTDEPKIHPPASSLTPRLCGMMSSRTLRQGGVVPAEVAALFPYPRGVTDPGISLVATVTIVSGANVGRSYEIGERELVVGRESICEIALPMRTVSRRHARFGRDKQGFYVEELCSFNGTFVNGLALEGRGRLTHLDRVRIGQNVLQFFEASADEQTISIDPAALKEFRGQRSESPAADDDGEHSSQHIVSSLDASGGGERLELNPQAKLRAVLDISHSVGSSLDMADVLPRILDSLFRIFPQADHGYILQAPRVGAPLEPIAIKHRNSDSDTISPLGGPIVARVMTEGSAFLSSPQAEEDSVLSVAPTSVMCAPLMGPAKTPLGVIHLDTAIAGKPFDQNDLDVLVAVATMAGQAVEYARMHADILELDRQKRDLATAQDVQLHFLPQKPPERAGYKFFDYYRAAATVAGDYYDYIRLPDGRLAIALGDVAGKGVPAALLMARLCSEVRYSLLTTTSAAEAANLLNRQLVDHLRSGRFITFILMILDTQRHEVQIVNAGHSPPLLRDRRTREIRSVASNEADIPLGINTDVVYSQVTLPLEPGSLLLFYTDGVNEALSPTDDVYGNERVRAVLSSAPDDAVHVGRALVADVRRFAGGRRQSDDICLIAFGRTAT